MRTHTTSKEPATRNGRCGRGWDTLPTALIAGYLVLVTPAWGQVINEDLELLASDGAVNDWLGFSVAIDDGVIAAGALWDDNKSGSVYLFNADTGAEVNKLVPDDGQAGDYFGHAVAIDNGVVVIGANLDDDIGTDTGSAYLFDITNGTLLAKLFPNDGESGDQFGTAVAIDGDFIVVSAHLDNANGVNSGSVYIFDRTTSTQLHKLLASDGTENDLFGRSLAIDNGIVAIGAYGDDLSRGAVYLFDASTGTQIAKLVASDGAAFDYFGRSVDIDNGIVIASALGDDDNGSKSGSAYLFDASTGAQLDKLLPADGTANDHFGRFVSIDGDTVVIGADRDDDNGPESGSAYLFDMPTGVQIAKLLASDGTEGDEFGEGLAISNGVIAVGAYRHDDNHSNSGSVYVFDINCEADLTGDGVIDTLDFLLFLGAYASGDQLADWNRDGDINTLDFLAFLNDWVAGCP